LHKGDLVFFAWPENPDLDVHVAIATGRMLQDPETGNYYPQVAEASSIAGYVTGQYSAYNEYDEETKIYSRSNSEQIVTYVVDLNLDWKGN